MKTCVLLLLVVGCVYGAPAGNGGLEPGSCEDASAVNAAHQALSKINLDRTEGYVFTLQRLSDVHLAKNGETGVVYYLTLDVVETNCSVLSRKDWKICQTRPTPTAQVYGQCKAAIYISKPHRVVRLYKYKCLIRPVPSARVHEICPDCPTFIAEDNVEIKKAVTLSLEKFNKEKGLKNHFALLRVARATAGMAMHMYYNVEYSIQETSCNSSTDAATVDKCPVMTCEFAHKGFCKASLYYLPNNITDVSVECEIFEPEAAEAEKVQHLLGDKTSHSHNDTHRHEHGKGHSHGHGHGHGHDHSHGNDHDHHHDHGKGNNRTHSHDHSHGNDHDHHHDHGKKNNRTHSHDHSHGNDHDHHHDHGKKNNRTHSHGHDHGKGHRHHGRFNNRTSPHDHLHDHTKDHSHHVQEHPADSDHHHTHDHKPGSAHRHSHAHSHDHGINHTLEHVHAYHSQAYDHRGDAPNHHHDYKHEEGTHTHEHDHELALDHDHKHGHLHEYEHHHHHHEHVHEDEVHDQPEGLLKKIGAIGQPITAPIFPEEPPKAVILLLKIDPQIPGVPEPNILGFPATGSAQCVAPTTGKTLVEKLFIEDNLFKPGNNF